MQIYHPNLLVEVSGLTTEDFLPDSRANYSFLDPLCLTFSVKSAELMGVFTQFLGHVNDLHTWKFPVDRLTGRPA